MRYLGVSTDRMESRTKSLKLECSNIQSSGEKGQEGTEETRKQQRGEDNQEKGACKRAQNKVLGSGGPWCQISWVGGGGGSLHKMKIEN